MHETHNNAPKEQLRALAAKLRRKGLKFLALMERARVSAARHPVSPLLYVVLLALVVGWTTFDGMYTQAYVLTVDGVEVGVVTNEEEVNTIMAHVETRASSILGEDYTYEADVELVSTLATEAEFSDVMEVEDTLFANAGALVEGYAVVVDGVELGYGPTEESIRFLLDAIAAPYITENTTHYDFVEDLQVIPVELPANTSYDMEGLYDRLTVCTVEEAYYTVKTGDTFNRIAYSLDMSPAELAELNPDVNTSRIYTGQQLVIQQAVPFLSVRTYANETYEAVVDSPIEYIETPDLYIGNTSVKEQGTDGLALVNADAVYVNGAEVERNILTSETLVEPTTTYMYTGTTPKPKTASNGYFIWPASGTITSYYGSRYIFGAYDFHLGIDIANKYGTNIYAADGGTVTYAGWKGSYGKLIIITHDDGRQTYYGHCSSLLVSAGQKVYQGQHIAEMGSTGNSTGSHLHFEIRVGGRTVNPLNYL